MDDVTADDAVATVRIEVTVVASDQRISLTTQHDCDYVVVAAALARVATAPAGFAERVLALPVNP